MLLRDVREAFREPPVNNTSSSSSSSNCSTSRAFSSRRLASSSSTHLTEAGPDRKPDSNTAAAGPAGGSVAMGAEGSQEAPPVLWQRARVGGAGTRGNVNSSGGRKLAGAMGLKEFMHRQRVLELYRGILKVQEVVCKMVCFPLYTAAVMYDSLLLIVLMRSRETVQGAGSVM